ncbi:DgyrCDS924 [Dimorphilus gyrociliatus]|uniref:DgyrCDS924 n=1 Tax=Dimorphilus gyrociliatus TaxID=2664684 RepID=A0A7I8V7J3_9ANNE|nr:DgyrCDS924 [Dimorphilus gyrociliatus]
MGKVKKTKDEVEEADDGANKGDQFKELLERVNAIANPIASRKLSKRILKIVILAGDVTPIDVISHFPVLCEESEIPYCYVPSKEHFGQAVNSKKWVLTAMITKNNDYEDLYNQVYEEVDALPLPIQ